jgi:hypothetical protein
VGTANVAVKYEKQDKQYEIHIASPVFDKKQEIHVQRGEHSKDQVSERSVVPVMFRINRINGKLYDHPPEKKCRQKGKNGIADI